MGEVIFFTAAMMCAFRSVMSCTVYVPPLPRDLADLKTQIISAVKNVDASLLTRVWQELEYCIDVCRVTYGVHTEYL
jgi:hypothetical protein